jgi:CP family cyanate transporter-like MFS transporter
LLIGEALPAAVTLPLVLPLVGGSWGWSFVAWSAPVAATLLLFAVAAPHRPRGRTPRSSRWWPDWRGALAPGLLLGGTGGCYFSANTFIPDYLHAIGQPALVGPCLTALNIGQLPASALILLFAGKLTGSRAAFVVSPLVAFAGLAAFFLPHPAAIVAAMGLVGFCCGIQLILSLTLPPVLAAADDVHRLSAGMFAIGYFVSFLMPPLGGAIWDATGMPVSAFIATALGIALVPAAALALPPLGSLRIARAG